MCYVCAGTQKLELQEVVSCLTECWDLNSFLEEQDMCCLSSHAKKKKILFKITTRVSRDEVIFPMNEELERWLRG